MSDYTNSAVYKVISWIIKELYDSGVLNEADYESTSPIIPIQQVPEAENNTGWEGLGLPADAPFIVYDVVVPGEYGTDFWNRCDEVMLWVYDYDIDKLFQIKEFLVDLLGRFDLAATDINEFDPDEDTFRFSYFEIMTGLPTDEIDKPLGRYGMNLVIKYEYVRPIGANGRFA